MLLLLLLVTPLVNAYGDSWPSPTPSPSQCTLPEPLTCVNCTECLNGTWYGILSNINATCYTETRIEYCDNTYNVSATEILKNGCGQTYYGTAVLGCNNTLTYTYPCKPEWNGDYVILATDCKTYVIFGICLPDYCTPVYFIEFSCQNPSNCTLNQVQEDAASLGIDYDDLYNICNNC